MGADISSCYLAASGSKHRHSVGSQAIPTLEQMIFPLSFVQSSQSLVLKEQAASLVPEAGTVDASKAFPSLSWLELAFA